MAAILVFFSLIADWPFWPRSRLDIPSKFTFESEANRVNLQGNKRILKWRLKWNKVYMYVMPFSQSKLDQLDEFLKYLASTSHHSQSHATLFLMQDSVSKNAVPQIQ